MTVAPAAPGAIVFIEPARYMDIFCDRISVCGAKYLDLGDDHVTEVHARAKGWHLWTGTTQDGRAVVVRLCPSCVDSGRRRLPPSPDAVQGEQMTLDI